MNDKDALFQLLPPPLRKVQNTDKQKLMKQTKPRQNPGLKKSSRQHFRQGKIYYSTLEMEQRKNTGKRLMKRSLEIIQNKTKDIYQQN